jgi:hypothetical protein
MHVSSPSGGDNEFCLLTFLAGFQVKKPSQGDEIEILG